jgi:hypothetical protein
MDTEIISIKKGTKVNVSWIEGTILNDCLIFKSINEDGTAHIYESLTDVVALIDSPEIKGPSISVKHLLFARKAREKTVLEDLAYSDPIEEAAFVRACYQYGLKPIQTPNHICPIAYMDELIVKQKIPGKASYFIVPAPLVEGVTEFSKKINPKKSKAS